MTGVSISGILGKIGRVFGLANERKRQERLVIAAVAAAVLVGLAVTVLGPWKALAIGSGAVVAALTLWKPEIAVLILAIGLPLEPFLLKFVPDEIYVHARYASEILVYVLFASALLRVWRDRKRPVTPLDLPFVLFLLTAVASMAVNAVPLGTGILGIRQITRFVLVFFAVVWLRPKEVQVRWLTVVMLTVVALESVLGIIQSLSGGLLDEFLVPSERRFFESIQLTTGTDQFWSPGSRIFATMGRYDQLGTFLCFFLLLAVGLLYCLHRDRISSRNLKVVLVLGVLALIMTMSRASWFGFALGVLAIGAWMMGDRRIRLGILAAVIAVIGYLVYNGVTVRYSTEYRGQTAVERLFESFSYERWRGEYYGMGRLYWMVQTPAVVVRSSPFLGVGPGQYGGGAVTALGNTRAYEKLNLPYGVYGTEGYIDNNWFSIWGETGTIGWLFYLWMFYALAVVSWRLWRKAADPWVKGLALGFFGALLAVTFQAFLATYLEVRTLAFYFWAYAGFVVAFAKKEKVIG
ncbi:O-antigen ligase family protein [Candidatus Uhrbacteria bacterium]|nr:O-antigen ligase family protein [Candidatus Uhrbacteria bacterium]